MSGQTTEATAPAQAPSPSLLAGASPATPAPPAAAAPAPDPAAAPVATPTAPEQYDFKFPEGITPDAPLMDWFTATAKAANLTQEQAQPWVDSYLKYQESQAQAYAATRTELEAKFQAEAKADKDFGGAKYAENVAAAHQGFAWMVAQVPEFLEAFQQISKFYPIDHDPAFQKAFWKLQQKIGDDKGVLQTSEQPQILRPADAMFGKKTTAAS